MFVLGRPKFRFFSAHLRKFGGGPPQIISATNSVVLLLWRKYNGDIHNPLPVKSGLQPSISDRSQQHFINLLNLIKLRIVNKVKL